MSCRVLSRTVENFLFNRILKEAKRHRLRKIVGTYIPTKKNGLVQEHFKKLGFSFVSKSTNGTTEWEFLIAPENNFTETFIEEIEGEHTL
jgi:predicted enzyme involved in methoxymalonyl-ACP biosynthesis